MNLHQMLLEREKEGRPIRVGLIGAGRFGAMYLAQARTIPGIHMVAVADINMERARQTFALVGWPEAGLAPTIAAALAKRKTAIVPNGLELFDAEIDVVVEATGNPIVGVTHALRAAETGKHIIMVNVETDAYTGPALAKRAREAGIVYSLAYGDQPAIITEMVDWARTSGFEVVCAGKGTKYCDGYHEMNPGNVWNFWEFPKRLTDSGQLNPNMHTSFRDGTKAAIEMVAVANACGLVPSDDGLTFSPGDVEHIATICRPTSAGGVLDREGTVDVMSSATRDGTRVPHNIQEGVFVVVKATNDYVAENCFKVLPWFPDPSGRYMALYRPFHFIGLELNISIANAVLRGVATGAPVGFYGDVVATAKKDLKAGEMLDGEGGYAVWGKLLSARRSLELRALPVAFSHNIKLKNNVAKGKTVSWDDVIVNESLTTALKMRRETEALLAPVTKKA